MTCSYRWWMKAAGRTLLLAGLLSATSPAGRAQELDVFAADVQVRLMNVDVVVTDPRGEPVRGLGREDFELLIGGRRLEISHFAELGGPDIISAASDTATAGEGPRSERRPAAASSPAPEPLSWVVYLDRSYLGPGDLKDVTAALYRFLESQARPRDRVMLVSADQRVEVLRKLEPMSRELEALLAAELVRQGRGLRVETEYRDILRSIDQTLEEGNDLLARHPEHHTQGLLARINAFSELAYRDVELTCRQLRQVIAGLSGAPGRKVVLYVGGRLPIQAGQALFSAWQSAFGRNSTRWQMRLPDGGGAGAGGGDGGNGAAAPPLDAGGVGFESMATPASHLDASELFARTAQLASGYGIRFYTLDAGGLKRSAADELSRGSRGLAANSGGSRWDYRQTQRVASQGALAELAASTGGRSLGESREFARLLGDVRRDLDSIYSLGFAPPEAAVGEPLDVEVRLRRSAERGLGRLTVRHRRFYQRRSADQEAAEETLSALLFGVTANPLRVEVSAAPAEATAGGGSKRSVPLSIRVPLAHLALVAESRTHTGRLSIFVTSGDLEGGAAPMRHAVVPVRIANEEILNVLGRNVEYTLDVEVASRAQWIAVGVRDDFAPLLSTVTVPVPGVSPADAAERPSRSEATSSRR